MKRHSGNASSIGTSTHPEKHYNHSTDSTKRSRYKCIHYEAQPRFCRKLEIRCVGPSNQLCTHYAEEDIEPEQEVVGRLINCPNYGIGMVINMTAGKHEPVCTVKFHKSNMERKYFYREIEKFFL